MRAETELLKEMRGVKRELSLVLKKQDMILGAMIPEAEPTKREIGIINSKKKFVGEKFWRRALER